MASLPNYRDDGIILDTSAYVTSTMLEDPAFNAADMRSMLAIDAGVWNMFVGDRWAIIGIVLLPDYNEITSAWEIIEFVEGRTIPWWERIGKADIYPDDPRIAVSGWVLGRWAIDQGLNKDMLMLPALGAILSFFVLWWWLGSIRQAYIGMLISILSGILITRGSIAVLHYLIPEIHERVYTLLSEANVIVQGFVCMHKFEAFREANGNSYERFMHARHIDSAIVLIVMLASMAFTSLYSYPIWQMREMALVSLVGVSTILIGSTIVLPAVYLAVEQFRGPEKDAALLPRAAKRPLAHLFPFALRIPARVSIFIGTVPFVVAGWLFYNGYITTNTSPREYIEGTLVERTYQFLDASGAGNDTLDFFVEWKGEEEYTVTNSAFLRKAWQLQNDLRPDGAFEAWQREKDYLFVVSFKNAGSVLDKAAQVAKESYAKPFPATNEEAYEIFTYILPSDVPREVRKALWNITGLRFTLAAVLNNSYEQYAMLERVQKFANERYPNLKVTPFGKNALYPQIDEYITGGQSLNIGVTLGGVFFLYLVWIFIHGWQYLPLVRGALILLMPFTFSVGVMGCFMAVAGIALSMSTAPIFDLSVNAAADFSVYILAKFFMECRAGKDVQEALSSALLLEGAVVFMDFILNTIAFIPLLTSQFEPVQELGWMMVLALMCCSVGVLVLVYTAAGGLSYRHYWRPLSETHAMFARRCLMIRIHLVVGLLYLSFSPLYAEEQPLTVENVMAKAAHHARGKEMIVGRGEMNVDGTVYTFTTGRVFIDDCEGVLTAFQAKYTSADGGSAGKVKWQTVRCEDISMASYMPSMGRARKVNAPMLSMLGGELTPYLTLTATSWERDYTNFSFVDNNENNPVIAAVRSKESQSPFMSCVWYFKKWQGVYVPMQIEYTREEGVMSQIFSDYKEVEGAPGYYAPTTITIGKYTTLSFESWKAVPEDDTVISQNHALLGGQATLF